MNLLLVEAIPVATAVSDSTPFRSVSLGQQEEQQHQQLHQQQQQQQQ